MSNKIWWIDNWIKELTALAKKRTEELDDQQILENAGVEEIDLISNSNDSEIYTDEVK